MDRLLYTSSSTPPVSGPNVLNNIAQKVGALFNSMVIKPTNITSSGNDYTITIDPILLADVVAGMGFYIQPNTTNTGPARIRVTSGNPYYDVTKANGDPLASDEFASDTVYFVVFFNGSFVILSSISAAVEDNTIATYVSTFNVSGTWVKPLDIPSTAFVDVELWGGGSGGLTASGATGGNGGGYIRGLFAASQLTSSVSIAIGAGGAAGADGGNTTFGAYLTAYGGKTADDEQGGPINPSSPERALGSLWRGGIGGGQLSSVTSGNVGGQAVFGGGGGGGGNTATAGGVSIFGGRGGNGGNPGTPGTAPGGAGGRNAAGAAGRAIVRVIG